MSRVKPEIKKLMQVLYRLGTQTGQMWPVGAWVYVKGVKRVREGYWFKVEVPHVKRTGYDWSESEANARGIKRNGNESEQKPAPPPGKYFYTGHLHFPK